MVDGSVENLYRILFFVDNLNHAVEKTFIIVISKDFYYNKEG